MGDPQAHLMTIERDDHESGRYEVRVNRHLDDHWAEWFGHVTLTRESDGTTTLCSLVLDQSALHGLLIKIRDLGMTLISVRAINGPTDNDNSHEGEQK